MIIISADEFYSILNTIENNLEHILEVLNEDPISIGISYRHTFDDFSIQRNIKSGVVTSVHNVYCELNNRYSTSTLFHIDMDNNYKIEGEMNLEVYSIIVREQRDIELGRLID